MSSPSPTALQQLRHLDRSSPGFHDQLSNVLYGEEYKQCVPDLRGDDLAWLVDYLDKALDCLDPSTAASRKCLRELRTICGARGMLPTSYTLSSDLLNISPEPFAAGGYGDVYEGTLDGSRVCIKRVKAYVQDGPQKAARTFCQEAIMWKNLKHPNVLPLLGITITPFQLVSNRMSGGDLPEYMEKHPDADRLGLLSDVAEGLCYLHSRNVIHGDLKGLNVLVDDSGHARIADFGLATVTQNFDSMSVSAQRGHTPRWSAPEVLYGGRCSKEADIFAFAMVMIEIYTCAIPFSDITSVAAMLAVMNGKRPSRPTHPALTDQLWTLIQCCWDQDPHLRPEVSDALQVILVQSPPAWKQLISPTLAIHKRIPLIESIFSDHDEVEVVGHLRGDDAQAFINVIDEALDSLPQQIRRRCLRSLYKICGRQALLPRPLGIPLCYDPMKHPMHRGRFADAWKGQYRGRDVAAKALRLRSKSDLGRIRKRFCREVVTWNALRHPNVLPLLGVTMTENLFVAVSEWMAKGNINEFVKVNTKAERLELLGDVTRGLIYMHEEGVVHGNLKGANVLINHDCRACLADFSLLTIASDRSTVISSCIQGGAIQWMSPEPIDPESFGLDRSRLTKESDCYVLGMVFYEVLSGRIPFAPSRAPLVIQKVLQGERPGRPRGERGALFTNGIWRTLELCWKHAPSERTSARAVLPCLEEALLLPWYSPDTDEIVETDTDEQSYATASDSGSSISSSSDGPLVPSQSPHRHLIATVSTGPPTTRSENIPPVPPHNDPPGATNPIISLDGSKPPRQDSSEGWVRWLAGYTREMFKAPT